MKLYKIKSGSLILIILISFIPIFQIEHPNDTIELNEERQNSTPSYETFIEDFSTTNKRDKKNTDVIQWGYGKIINSKIPPQLVGSYDPPNWQQAIYASGNFAYVGFGPSVSSHDPNLPVGALVLDVSDKNNPVKIGQYQGDYIKHDYENPYTPGPDVIYIYDDIRDIDIEGDYLYAAGAVSFQILDISDKSNPTLVGKIGYMDIYPYNMYFMIKGTCYDVDVVYPYAYVTCEFLIDPFFQTYKKGLNVIDVSDPRNPTVVGTLITRVEYDIAVSYPYAYIPDGVSGIKIVDVSNPSNPHIVNTYDVPRGKVTDICLLDNYLYLACYVSGLLILDISNPTNPNLIGQYQDRERVPHLYPFGPVRDVNILQNFAYIHAWNKIQVLDISTKSNPTLIAEIPYLGGQFQDCSGDNYFNLPIDDPLQIYDITNRDLYISVCQAQSIKINSKGYVDHATLTAVDNNPDNTDIKYYLSADGGSHWEEVSLGIEHSFINPGFDLRWRTILSTTDSTIAPSINELIINYELDKPPTMDTITEPEDQYYSFAPIFNHLGFNDDVALDDGWYQIDSYTGEWIPLFVDYGGKEWNYDDWILPGFDELSEGYHRIYFRVTDIVGNEVGGQGEWKWGFYKEVGDKTPPIITIEYQDGDGTDGNPGKWNVSAYDDESGINEDTINILINGEFCLDEVFCNPRH